MRLRIAIAIKSPPNATAAAASLDRSVVAHPAHPPRFDSGGGAGSGGGAYSSRFGSSITGAGGLLTIGAFGFDAQSGHASRTRCSARSSFVRALLQRAAGSIAHSLSVARRIESSA